MRSASYLAAFLALAGAAVLAGDGTPPVIPMKLPSGKVLQTELMISDHDRRMGLMFRPSLPEDRALLFVFNVADFHAIWMKNCKFAIDIVWLDKDRKVVHVAEAVPPCKKDPCPTYEPLRKASYVVEMNAGQAQREKVAVGSVIEFRLPG